MQTSDQMRQKIRVSVGLELTARRIAGVLTIGYGHTGPDVEEGYAITQDVADILFARDIAVCEASVMAEIGGTPTTQDQFDAIVSSAYSARHPA